MKRCLKLNLFLLTSVWAFSAFPIDSIIKVPVDDSSAIDFYRGSQLVVSKAAVNPYDLAGCLVLIKEGEEDTYVNILPESIKKHLKPENLTGQPYRTMMTEGQAVKVGFLGSLGITTKEKSLLEISIDNRWKLIGPSFLNDDELKKTVLSIGKIYSAIGYTVKYNQSVEYSNLTTSIFSERSGKVASSFTYIDASGKQFVQSSNYAQRELIAISPFDITPFLVSWQPTQITAVEFQISEKDIESMRSALLVKASSTITLKQGDLSEIKDLQLILNEEQAPQILDLRRALR